MWNTSKYTIYSIQGFITVFALAIALTQLSCKKYLDKKSDSTKIIPETLQDLQALLDQADRMNMGTPSMGEAAADDYFLTDDRYNIYDGTVSGFTYKWEPSTYYFLNDWAKSYLPVYVTNECLERVEHISHTSQNIDQWNNVKGSALFYRAYHFSQLAWVFAKAYDPATAQTDLGIVLRMTPDFNVPSVRATVKETYERIITDAKESIAYLPDHPQHVMRPSRAAAYGLLARTFLSMRQYDSAYKYANLCLSLKSELLNFNNPQDVNVGNATPFRRFNKEIVFHSEVYFFIRTIVPSGALIDTVLYSTYVANDRRRTAYFRASGAYQRPNNTYAEVGLFTGIATDEMYLLRAECLARQGDKDGALEDLNTLLVTRYTTGTFTPVTAPDAATALDIILLERRKELIRRGLRWIDIKRLNKEGRNITLRRIIQGQTFTLPPNDDRYALPLPADIVNSNIPQN